MKTTFNKLALLSTAVFAIGLGATTASAASINATAKAKVIAKVSLTKQSDLDFGQIVTGPAASTVDISQANVRTCGAGLTCVGTSTAGNFTVFGQNNEVVRISVPASVTLNNTSGTGTMVATLNAPATLNLGTTGQGAGVAFRVGGTLGVGANQAEGVYASNDFAVTADYQ